MNKIIQIIDKYKYIFYPILLALFPLASFYGTNIDEIQSGNFRLLPFIVLNLSVAVAAWLVAFVATKNSSKASILTSVFLILFFSFGRVDNFFDPIISRFILLFGLGPTRVLIIISLGVLAGVWLWLRTSTEDALRKTDTVLLVVSSIMLLSASVTVVPHIIDDDQSDSSNDTTESIVTKSEIQNKPDIYYILLDGYARADYLKSSFNYDNTTFIDSLKQRKFYVAEKANANYAHTFLSVPSTFNMKYVNNLKDKLGEESTNQSELKNMTQRHSVGATYKSLGYKYVNVGTQWGWTKTSPLQDLDIAVDNKKESKILNIELDEFALVYLQTTALKPWIESDLRGGMVTQILDALEKTEKVSRLEESTFTFTHLLLPHPPYLFNKEGIIPGQTKLELDNHGFADKDMYLDQTIYTNKLALELVDTIIENSKEPPIIIVASDHGPASSLRRIDFENIQPEELDTEGVKERMAILNAYYFPDQNYSKLYQHISPVNTFRLILSQYFGQDIDLLPDRSYFSDNKKNLYRFADVTDLTQSQ